MDGLLLTFILVVLLSYLCFNLGYKWRRQKREAKEEKDLEIYKPKVERLMKEVYERKVGEDEMDLSDIDFRDSRGSKIEYSKLSPSQKRMIFNMMLILGGVIILKKHFKK